MRAGHVNLFAELVQQAEYATLAVLIEEVDTKLKRVRVREAKHVATGKDAAYLAFGVRQLAELEEMRALAMDEWVLRGGERS